MYFSYFVIIIRWICSLTLLGSDFCAPPPKKNKIVLKTLIDFCAKENTPNARSAMSPLWEFFEKRKEKSALCLVGSGSALDASALLLLLLRNDQGLRGRWRIRVLSQRRHLCSFHIPASSSSSSSFSSLPLVRDLQTRCVSHSGICVSFISFFFPRCVVALFFPMRSSSEGECSL